MASRQPPRKRSPYLQVLRSAKSYELYGHWLARRRGSSLLEVRGPDSGYHIRLWPTRVAEFVGADFHNRPLDAVRPRDLAEKLGAWCGAAVSEMYPVAGHCALSGTLSDTVFEGVAMPLSRNGRTADMVLGGLFPLEFAA